MQPAVAHTVTVWCDDQRHTIKVADGANLRQVLLDAGLSPYATLTRQLNCGGRGRQKAQSAERKAQNSRPERQQRKTARQSHSRKNVLRFAFCAQTLPRGRRDPARRWKPE